MSQCKYLSDMLIRPVESAMLYKQMLNSQTLQGRSHLNYGVPCRIALVVGERDICWVGITEFSSFTSIHPLVFSVKITLRGR